MDFRFTEEEEGFRREVRQFLNQELPPGWLGLGEMEEADSWEFTKAMARKLAARNWLGLAWPREYGGQARSITEQIVFGEEMSYRGAPGVDIFGISMLGPTLMVWGSEEQKKEHLPPIIRGEIFWCQGYSEPGAGSDLASLQTRAVDEGDYFVVNGQKVWSSNAHNADRIFFLARTDPQAPKHKGISFFLADKKTPGITVRPLINAANLHSFNEVYFDDFRVPKKNLVGPLNQGWYVGATLLNFERSGISNTASARRFLEYLMDYARKTKRDGRPLARDPHLRARLADRAIEIEVSRMLAYRIGWMQSQGQVPIAEASAGKVFGTEMNQRLAGTAMELLGLQGLLLGSSKGAWLKGRVPLFYINCLGMKIAGGTSEIQRNIIAQRGLGLPRGA